MFVFDDYAGNIQQNQEETAFFARKSRDFWGPPRRDAGFPGGSGLSGRPGHTAMRRRRGSNCRRNRPVAEIIATWKPAPA